MKVCEVLPRTGKLRTLVAPLSLQQPINSGHQEAAEAVQGHQHAGTSTAVTAICCEGWQLGSWAFPAVGAFKRGLEGGARALGWGGQGLLCGACAGEDAGRSELLYARQATPGVGQFRGSGELQCLLQPGGVV